MGVGGGQLLAVITPGLLGIFSNLRQRWKATDLFLTSIKVSFVAPLTVDPTSNDQSVDPTSNDLSVDPTFNYSLVDPISNDSLYIYTKSMFYI